MKPGKHTLRIVAILGSLVIGLTVALACQDPETEASRPLRITVFELEAHGLAIALETPSGAVYFVDTGAKEGDDDAGKHTLAPFLRKRGVSAIAGILVSHPHHDHFEGARYLLKHFSVKSFLDGGAEGSLVDDEYVELKERARERGAECRVVRAGDTLPWDPDLEVTVLAPPKGGVESKEKDLLNDNSIVLRIRHGKNVILLPGDIEHDGSESLLASVPAETLRSTVLVAPHHGFFEERRFVEAVQPQTVVVSCQREYSDKEPRSPGDLAKAVFGAVGAKVYVTAWNGTVSIVSDGATCAVSAERETK